MRRRSVTCRKRQRSTATVSNVSKADVNQFVASIARAGKVICKSQGEFFDTFGDHLPAAQEKSTNRLPTGSKDESAEISYGARTSRCWRSAGRRADRSRPSIELSDWEILADAVNQALGAKGIKRTDEMRRAREEMDSAAYRDMTYYERWIASIEAILIEKKILTEDEINRKLAQFESKWGEP